ncbi:acetyltransferase [Fictibacillus macauensis ZFHKF-1]|uniref:Acetyltransferase n=1 Tax=Fictibacillus macauensis ZFHKF-1 TaxID=1196324 RepID=I8AFV9_9BACL|nr:hypothetical protein [Fictibacillus macauensis]EIT84497.1 acetyltransferase [Fictibacillus macauensis ZFHKF-1]
MNDTNLGKGELESLVSESRNKNVTRIGVVINKSAAHYLQFSKLLVNHGFTAYASKVEVTKLLQGLTEPKKAYEWRSISTNTLTEAEFKKLWSQCRIGSENRTSSLSIEEHVASVQQLLGEKWRDACVAFYEGSKAIGITIPHIEPGTQDEGRLFYFGLVPEERGRGRSGLIHTQSLWLLKQMGATFYKGSTHETNLKMQKVFLNNACSITRHIESYYLDLT